MQTIKGDFIFHKAIRTGLHFIIYQDFLIT